jgi:hypothetical protein
MAMAAAAKSIHGAEAFEVVLFPIGVNSDRFLVPIVIGIY